MAIISQLGGTARKRTTELVTGLDGITEYIETWMGMATSGDFPQYAPGSPSGYGATVWYSIRKTTGQQRGSQIYIAKASDRFLPSKWKWSVSYGIENFIAGFATAYWSYDGTHQFAIGGTPLHRPYVCPIITRESWYTTLPTAVAGAVGAPAGCPISYTTPSQPAVLVITPDHPVWGFLKANAEPILTEQGWKLIERWHWTVVSGAA